MNLSVIGTGYVGLTLAIALTKVGHTISCYDINDELINDLKNGKTAIKEPEILDYLNEGINKKKLFFYKYNDQINLDDVF